MGSDLRRAWPANREGLYRIRWQAGSSEDRKLKSCITALFLILSCASGSGFETGYWAWQRNEAPSAGELDEVKAQGVHTVYWQVGELIEDGATWRWNGRFELPASTNELRFVPVVRLESRERSPFSTEANALLVSLLAQATRGADELQIDYDAPDRLIADYAAMLKRLHKSCRA